MTRPSSTSAYVHAILERLGAREPLAVLGELPREVARRVEGLEDAACRRPEAPGKWSVLEVVQHLADTELVFGWRTRLVLEQDNPPLHAFDENAWVARFDYAHADLADALAQLAALRTGNLRLWRACTPADLARTGQHGERGPESLDLMLHLWAGHDLVHRAQLDRILRAVR